MQGVCVPKTSSTSCDQAIFVDQATDASVRGAAAGGGCGGGRGDPDARASDLGVHRWGFGMARNPWDLSRTCGGSSGGSAAAVAGVLVPLAHGNDGLGSIRVPAAACGVVGIKPGFGLVPAEPGGDNWTSMGENGPIATTVADAALGLSVMAGDPALARVSGHLAGCGSRWSPVHRCRAAGSTGIGRAPPARSPICWPVRATRWNRRSCRSRCGHGGRCTPAGSRPPRITRP